MTPAQIQQVIEQLEREGYILCKKEPVAWMNPYGGLLHRIDTGIERETHTVPLYSAAPAYTPKKGGE